MTKQPNKKKFEVLENETITDCLARMEQEAMHRLAVWKSQSFMK
ncbi:hypothetical protein B353_24426 [Bacillus anthracis str. UR-1]|nr:hypothetical protein B353_24426 [Bacillus anthracis str. UR-1]